MPEFNTRKVARLLADSLVESWEYEVGEDWGHGDWTLWDGKNEYSVDAGSIVGGPKAKNGSVVVPVSDGEISQNFRITVSFQVEPVGEPEEY